MRMNIIAYASSFEQNTVMMMMLMILMILMIMMMMMLTTTTMMMMEAFNFVVMLIMESNLKNIFYLLVCVLNVCLPYYYYCQLWQLLHS